ncbi:ParM/StbA family protein [Desulfoscipio geothermicus]|uniref:Plasmid segregation protein ParM n=1 Tax=Desulfoscipio geothermicus DSM 3669 TaxID=1121426 RepID=A0A1I6E2C6_9FIRM|nr:ParM/StbA family protein [Desulfoscipio geothermicus]SFR11722.1 plasmid segregation protein ParM [Desulfoscipio geothermicus DSM 3669]
MTMQEARICQFPQKEYVWAVDVGYGYTKAVSSLGKRVCFPSVISSARDLPLAELANESIGHTVVIRKEGAPAERFFVGQLALKEGRSVQFTLDDVKHKHPVHDVVLLTALALLEPEAAGKLVVGLPVDYYREQGKSLSQHLTNLTATVSVDGGPVKQISFDNVLVYPQGAGALLVAPDMPSNGIVALVDVGHKTTDCVALELGNGGSRPVQSMCISVEAGIVHLHQAVIEEFLKLTGIRLPAVYTEQVLRTGRVWFKGQELDLSHVLADARKVIARSIADGVLAAWGDRADFVRRVYLAGGGALELPGLADMFSGASVIPDAQFANVLGFLKFGES